MRRAAEPDGDANIPPARLVDWPNRLPGPHSPVVVLQAVGVTAPDGVPRLISLKRFKACALKVSEYLWPVFAIPPRPPPNIPPPPPPPPPPRPPPPPGPPSPGPPMPPPNPPGPPPGPPPCLIGPAVDSTLGPIPNARLTRRFTATAAGPVPRFDGTIVSPACGTVSRFPKLEIGRAHV